MLGDEVSSKLPEVWLRGPVPEISAPLQPIAHAILQVREEVHDLLDGLPSDLLWTRPAGVASIGFHLQHLAGVLDRLFTYARGDALDAQQWSALRQEGSPPTDGVDVTTLLQRFDRQVERALQQLRDTPVESLTEKRQVGRSQLPSTVLGLLSHAAEHSQRHLGQLLVTVRVQWPGEGE